MSENLDPTEAERELRGLAASSALELASTSYLSTEIDVSGDVADMDVKACSIEGCEGLPVVARGFCRRHYERWHRYGNPEEPFKRLPEVLTWLKEQVANRDRNGGCWEWPFSTTGRGYGQVVINGRRVRAHNAALILDGFPEPPPPNNFGLHDCDNPICFNPAHLKWGSQLDNMADARSRNRMRRGETIPWSVFKESDIPRIRADKRPNWQIAQEFGVCADAVRSIKCGRTWSHVSG